MLWTFSSWIEHQWVEIYQDLRQPGYSDSDFVLVQEQKFPILLPLVPNGGSNTSVISHASPNRSANLSQRSFRADRDASGLQPESTSPQATSVAITLTFLIRVSVGNRIASHAVDAAVSRTSSRSSSWSSICLIVYACPTRKGMAITTTLGLKRNAVRM